MFLNRIAKVKARDKFTSWHSLAKDKSDSLGSISAFVTEKDERDVLAEDLIPCSVDMSSSEEDSELESETDDEEYQCVVCKLDFVGEAKYEHHRRISQHWG